MGQRGSPTLPGSEPSLHQLAWRPSGFPRIAIPQLVRMNVTCPETGLGVKLGGQLTAQAVVPELHAVCPPRREWVLKPVWPLSRPSVPSRTRPIIRGQGKVGPRMTPAAGV